MTQIHQSSRLSFRPANACDAKQVFRFLGDPVAMRYTHKEVSVEACQSRILRHEMQRATVGFAPWAISLIGKDKIIGWGGLYIDPFDSGWGLEIGYFFAPSVWGNGYATELTGFCSQLLVAREWHGELLSFSHPENFASSRVLMKNGFTKMNYNSDMNRQIWGKSV